MFENQVAGLLRQCQTSSRTESDEHRGIGLLQVREPSAIAVFGQRRCFGRHRVGRAPSPATSPMAELLHLGFQVSDEGTCSTNLFPKWDLRPSWPFRGREAVLSEVEGAPAPPVCGEPFDSAQ